jgi:hypothetical protein
MTTHLATALALYESNSIDLQSLIGWHLSYGIVLSTPKVFALCFHSRNSEPEKAVTFEQSDTLYVTMCCGNMLSGLQSLKGDYKYISFRRDFKESSRRRLFSIIKFYSKIKKGNG